MHAGGADGIRKAAVWLLLLMLMVLWAREAVAQEEEAATEVAADRTAFVLDVQGPYRALWRPLPSATRDS